MDNGCQFTFLASNNLPEITGPATANFDEVSGQYQIIITGTDFTDAASDIELFLSGKAQTVLSATSTEVVIQVDTLESGISTNTLDLYFSVGLPNGYTELESGINFTPKLLSLSANTGSAAGSIITAIVKGVGIKDQVTLYDEATRTNICASSRVTAYGELECLTIAEEIADSTKLSVMEVDSGAIYPCAANDASSCNYQTFESSQQMTVSATVVLSATELKFTGSLFPSETCEGLFLGMVSDSCTVESSTSVVATFNTGVPTSSTDVIPQLRFITNVFHYAKFDISATIQNPLSVTATTAGLVSSFAGGRKIEITADGLTSDIKLNKAEVRICEKTCVPREADSTN